MATDFIVFALLCHPQSVGVGSTWTGTVRVCADGCCSTVRPSLVLLPANLVTEPLVARWGLRAMLAPAPGFGGGNKDASAACRAWQRSNHLDRVAAAATGARAARLEPRWGWLSCLMPPSLGEPSLPGHPAAPLQSQLLQMINPLISTNPEPRRETSE